MDFILLIIIFIFIYFTNQHNNNIEKFELDQDQIIENFDINLNKYNDSNIKINNINTVREQTTYSKYAQDRIDFKNMDFKENENISDIYDFLVDNGRTNYNKYEKVETNDFNDYYNLEDEDNYGYTNFSNYKTLKTLKKDTSLMKEC